MKTILVPTDFSKNALNAVKYALAYAQYTKSKIILFHSYNEPTEEVDVPFLNVHYGKQEAHDYALKQTVKIAKSLLKKYPEARIKPIVMPGSASQNIADYVEKNKIPLIIMGTTGQGAVARVLIGSTTASVIADAQATIIAIPPSAKFKEIKKIAVATDMEKENLKAMTDAVVFAKKLKAELTFIHVQDMEVFNAEQLLQKMLDKITTKISYKKVSFYVCRDLDVAHGLDYFIKKNKPEILSMVTHTRTFPEIIWKTSWTNKMSNHIHIPLLVLHTDAKK